MENAAFVLDFCKKNNIPVTFTAENICNKEHTILILEFILTIADRLGWSYDPSSLPDSSSPPPASSPSPSPRSPSPTSPSASPSPPPTLSQKGPTTARPPPSSSSSPAPHQTLKGVFDDLIASEKEFLQEMDLFFKVTPPPLFFLWGGGEGRGRGEGRKKGGERERKGRCKMDLRIIIFISLLPYFFLFVISHLLFI